MSQSYDAVVIGAGIIGASVARELAAKGYRTLSVDRLPAASYGSTANSCAIIRPYYSTVHGSGVAGVARLPDASNVTVPVPVATLTPSGSRTSTP